MKRLTMLAGLDVSSGYGQTAIAIARGLEALGVQVQIRASSVNEKFAKIPDDIRAKIVHGVQADPWELLIHHPNFVPTPGKRSVYITMNESTKLPPLGPHLLNKAEVVVTPSQFCAWTFSACGVTAPIRVVPLGVDPKIYHWRPFPNVNDIVFGTAGDGPRKGLDDVGRAFQKAFPKSKFPNVRLRIKCHSERPDEWCDDRIDATTKHLTDLEMAEWYASLTHFVSVSKGEGFGLIPLQAMAIGRRLISHGFGGVTEFFNDGIGHIVPHTLSKASPPYSGHWAEVSEEDLIFAMQLARMFGSAAEAVGKTSARATQDFTWTNSVIKLVAVLNEFDALPEVEEEFHAR